MALSHRLFVLLWSSLVVFLYDSGKTLWVTRAKVRLTCTEHPGENTPVKERVHCSKFNIINFVHDLGNDLKECRGISSLYYVALATGKLTSSSG